MTQKLEPRTVGLKLAKIKRVDKVNVDCKTGLLNLLVL